MSLFANTVAVAAAAAAADDDDDKDDQRCQHTQLLVVWSER